MPSNPSLEEIADRFAIQDLLTRYTVAIDQKDYELLDTCFVPDAYVDYTSSGGIKGSYAEARVWLEKALAIFPVTQHFISNYVIELAGDKAKSRTYLINPMGFKNPDGVDARLYRVRLLQRRPRTHERRLANRPANRRTGAARRFAAGGAPGSELAVAMLFEHARRDPSGLAAADGTRRRSWSELASRTLRAAHFMRDELGLAPGDHVALLMNNRVEVLEALQGAIFAGLWVTPINWHLAPDEIDYVVQDSGARALFTDEDFVEVARAAAAQSAGCEVVTAGEELDRLLDAASDAPLDPEGPGGGNMIYTSGTTGRPKGVKRAKPATLQGVFDGQAAWGRSTGLDGSGPHLVTGPMYHAAPLMFAVYDQANGAPIEILPRWDETAALETIQEREIAHAHLVPTMFVRLLRLPDAVRDDFHAPRLDLVLHGAAPVSVPVKQRMIEWWGPVLVEYWGATEGGVNTLIDSEDWLANPGTVGRALPAFELFAVDDVGERLPAGVVGDLYCRHRHQDHVFEYHGDPEKTAASYLEPGVFTIGDVGSVDEAGYVRLADRKSSMIISGGVNIYPAEVEHVLQEHPAVADVGVFGIPDDEWGESVKAAVELAPGYEASASLEEEILEFGRGQLARYKVPRSIDFEDELPRHPSGKLYTRRLRDRYWEGRGRKI